MGASDCRRTDYVALWCGRPELRAHAESEADVDHIGIELRGVFHRGVDYQKARGSVQTQRVIERGKRRDDGGFGAQNKAAERSFVELRGAGGGEFGVGPAAFGANG